MRIFDKIQIENRDSKLQTLNYQSNQIDFFALVVQEKVILSGDHLRNMISFGNRAVRILNSSSRKSTSC